MPLLTTGVGNYAVAAVGGWSPADLTGLVGWYNFDPGNFSQSSGNITAVTDLSGNGHDLSPTGGNVPYSATAFNGHPCANFIAVNNAALIKTSFAMGTGKPWTLYIAGQMDEATDGDGAAATYSDGANEDYADAGGAILIMRDGGDSAFRIYRGGAGSPASGTFTAGTPIRFGSLARDIGSGFFNYRTILNLTQGSGSSLNISFTSGKNLVIGSRWMAGLGPSNWDGPIAEIVVCNVDIGNTDLALLDAYYVAKYGI